MPDELSGIIQTLGGMAQKAAEPEKKEPGPGDVGPTINDTKHGSQLVTLPYTEDSMNQWFVWVERAKARIKSREDKWDILLNEYLPVVSKSGDAETVKYTGHFRNVHTKMGQLFYRSPTLVMTAKDPSPAQNQLPNPMNQFLPPGMPPLPPLTMEDIISVKQAVLMDKLGPDGIDANRLYDELLFDILAWAGIGCYKVGYRCVMKPYQKPVMQPDPNYLPPLGTPLSLAPQQPPPMVPVLDPATNQPKTTTELVPVFEEYYSRRFSPKKLLADADLMSTRFDEDATCMGMEFYMSPRQAMLPVEKGGFGLTEAEVSKASEDDRRHLYEEDKQGSKAPGLLHGYELWPKASYYTDEVHPQAICQLVLIEGIKEKPIIWRMSPDQDFDEMGKLTKDSLIGFPIRVLTIRDLPDSCFPPSDAAFTNSQIKQIGTWRRQSVMIRDAAIGKYFYDSGAFEDTDIQLLKTGGVGEFIGVKSGLLAQGADKIFTTTKQVGSTPDDVRGQEILKQDMDETLGISSWSAGAPQDTVRTATEVANVQTAVASRNDKELGRVVADYLKMARMVDQLLMRYATQDDYTNITGEDGAKRIMVWNNQIISGRFLYEIAPDSQMRPDTARDWQETAEFYNITAPDPLTNRAYILRKMARLRGWDPSKVVLTPEAQMMQAMHGGTATAGDVVNKHQATNSGKRPNEPGAQNKRETSAA